MRRHTDFTAYNRAQAFRKLDNRPAPMSNALAAMAANESQLLFIFLKLSGAIDDPSIGRWRPGPEWTVPRATEKDIKFALRFHK